MGAKLRFTEYPSLFRLEAATRKILDPVILLATGALCIGTAYWLIHDDFVWIYGACFVYTAIATWRLSSSWLKKTFWFLSALLLSLALAEGVLSLAESAEQESERKSGSYTKGYSRPLRENGGVLGYRPYAARQVQSWKTFGRERLYDVVYTIDGDGYRQTPGFTGEEEAGEPIVFFGGSFAFGEGVNAILKRDYHAGFVVLLWDDETEASAQILEELAEKGIRTIKVSDLIPDTEMDAYRIPQDHHPTAAANKLIAQGLTRLGDLDRQ